MLFVVTDLVWSDPEDVDAWAVSPRGAGFLFGAKVTNEVLLTDFLSRGGDFFIAVC